MKRNNNHYRCIDFGGIVYEYEFCTEYPTEPGYWTKRISKDELFENDLITIVERRKKYEH